MRLCVHVGGFVLNVGGIWRVTNHAGGMGGVSADKKVPIFPFPYQICQVINQPRQATVRTERRKRLTSSVVCIAGGE